MQSGFLIRADTEYQNFIVFYIVALKSCTPNARKKIFYCYVSELLLDKTKQQFTVQVNLKIE